MSRMSALWRLEPDRSALADRLPGELGEEGLDRRTQVSTSSDPQEASAFSSIEPGRRGRGEVEHPGRMPLEPGAGPWGACGRRSCRDGVDDLAGRDSLLNLIQEADEFLMAVALHVAADDASVEDAARRGCARPRDGRGPAPTWSAGSRSPHRARRTDWSCRGTCGSPGWVRSSAWIWLFSSIERRPHAPAG